MYSSSCPCPILTRSSDLLTSFKKPISKKNGNRLFFGTSFFSTVQIYSKKLPEQGASKKRPNGSFSFLFTLQRSGIDLPLGQSPQKQGAFSERTVFLRTFRKGLCRSYRQSRSLLYERLAWCNNRIRFFICFFICAFLYSQYAAHMI